MAANPAAGRPDPLTDVVLCPTTGRALEDSQAWGQSESARTRVAAVARSRAAILRGAARALEADGTKVTMAQIAGAAGVAKATLYNHFRTREDVLTALLLEEVEELVTAVDRLPLAEALRVAATELSGHPLLEALGGEDLAVLAGLACVDVRTPGWRRVSDAVDALLAATGRRGTPTVLRWLASFLVAPADERDIADDVAVLVAGLPSRRP